MAKKVSPIEFALDFETKGTIAYLKLARKTKNPLCKALFYSLARQEIDHAKRADELFSAPGAGVRTDAPGVLPSVEKELREFFDRAKASNLKKDADDMAGYELAMAMERKGYETYETFRDTASSDAERKFFDRLMKEERTHLDSLANVHYYLTKTGDWLEEDERRVWSWMNL